MYPAEPRNPRTQPPAQSPAQSQCSAAVGLRSARLWLAILLMASWASPQLWAGSPQEGEGRATHPWRAANPSPATADAAALQTLEERFPVPRGFVRKAQDPGSFGAWLRALPVRPAGSPVLLYNGQTKRRQVHAAVLEIDVGQRDLQQCADAVIRLRAEHLFEQGCDGEIAFDFTSGDRAHWKNWASGQRPRVDGNRVSWQKKAGLDTSYTNFRRYLRSVFTYAGTHSLAKELERVAEPGKIEPGDVFIQGGFPGHAVLVVDVAVASDERDGEQRRFLLAQSYMPAQDIHVLQRPGAAGDPWYPARSGGPLATPEWPFDYGDLHRFPSSACAGTVGDASLHPR